MPHGKCTKTVKNQNSNDYYKELSLFPKICCFQKNCCILVIHYSDVFSDYAKNLGIGKSDVWITITDKLFKLLVSYEKHITIRSDSKQRLMSFQDLMKPDGNGSNRKETII